MSYVAINLPRQGNDLFNDLTLSLAVAELQVCLTYRDEANNWLGIDSVLVYVRVLKICNRLWEWQWLWMYACLPYIICMTNIRNIHQTTFNSITFKF